MFSIPATHLVRATFTENFPAALFSVGPSLSDGPSFSGQSSLADPLPRTFSGRPSLADFLWRIFSCGSSLAYLLRRICQTFSGGPSLEDPLRRTFPSLAALNPVTSTPSWNTLETLDDVAFPPASDMIKYIFITGLVI